MGQTIRNKKDFKQEFKPQPLMKNEEDANDGYISKVENDEVYDDVETSEFDRLLSDSWRAVFEQHQNKKRSFWNGKKLIHN